ncbi:SETMR methyltransferase, partial [Acromyrmex insinuator]
MEKNEFRAVIKHLNMKIKAKLDNVHNIFAPAFATVYNWVNEFKRGMAVISILHKQLDMKKLLAKWCLAPMAKFNEFRYELFSHPAYSSDLTPCDYFLFPNLKKWFRGKRFTIREQLIAEPGAYFEELDKSYYSDLKKLENRWIKCIELKGDYEK